MVDIELDSENWRQFSEDIENQIFKVFFDAMNELYMMYGAFQEASESARSKVKSRSFSVCHGELMEMQRKANNGELQNIPERKLQCREGDLKTLQKLLNVRHDFIVSMDTMGELCDEVWILFKATQSSVPELYCQRILREGEFRLAKEKAVFAMGKAVSMLRESGRVKSDIPTKAGRSKRKGYIDEQKYFDLLYSDSFEAMGKTRHATCKRIHDEAVKRENARAERTDEKPKSVKSIKQIGEILKPKLDKLFP